MEKLETSINKINTLALKIDSTLETKRTEIKKLDLINKDLSNLKKLCEFPNLLKKELEKYKVGSYEIGKLEKCEQGSFRGKTEPTRVSSRSSRKVAVGQDFQGKRGILP